MNIIGPLPPSLNGDKYIITFQDDCTHYCVSMVLKMRTEVPDAFIEYIRNATAKFNSKVHKLRCDNALKFVASKMHIFCDETGIILQPAEPYLHEHNGTIECMNRNIMERARALLYDAKLPKTFWHYTVFAAVYLINRTSSSAIEYKTPYERWNNGRVLRNHHL